jgi:hypothetical protein
MFLFCYVLHIKFNERWNCFHNMRYSDPEDGQMFNTVRIVRKYSICLTEMRQLFCFRALDRLIVASF